MEKEELKKYNYWKDVYLAMEDLENKRFKLPIQLNYELSTIDFVKHLKELLNSFEVDDCVHEVDELIYAFNFELIKRAIKLRDKYEND